MAVYVSAIPSLQVPKQSRLSLYSLTACFISCSTPRQLRSLIPRQISAQQQHALPKQVILPVASWKGPDRATQSSYITQSCLESRKQAQNVGAACFMGLQTCVPATCLTMIFSTGADFDLLACVSRGLQALARQNRAIMLCLTLTASRQQVLFISQSRGVQCRVWGLDIEAAAEQEIPTTIAGECP